MAAAMREVREAIERFLTACRRPALQAEGDRLFFLVEGSYALTERPDAIVLEAWNEETNVARRIKAVKHERPGRMDLAVELFGRKSGLVSLVDLDHAAGAVAERTAKRREFRERFAYFLRRWFTEWRIAELTTEADLEHSLSPVYPRALLRRGRQAMAALGAPAGSGDGALAFGLIWLDYLRRREPSLTLEGLILYIPLDEIYNTCLRLRWLDAGAARFVIVAHAPGRFEEYIDPRDCGNIDTRLEPCAGPGETAARAESPEARLEALVRDQIQVIAADLNPAPVYGQVPALAGLNRGVLDLLAVSNTGRLCVIELKAAEDLQLPVQALDYWLRVAWHAARGEFGALGYFPGVPLRPDPPRLYLVAPAVQFHPTTEILLRYFSPRVEVERVGIALPWENEVRVLFRATGARPPGF